MAGKNNRARRRTRSNPEVAPSLTSHPNRSGPTTAAGRNQSAITERKNGIIFGVVTALMGTSVVMLILLFGFQGKLSVLDRCNCSWEKVIIFSVAAFVALAVQTISYIMYQSKCSYYKNIANHAIRNRWRKQKLSYLMGTTLLFSLISLVLIYIVLPLLVDQNNNILWFVQRGMGILCIVVTLIESVLIGIFQKLIFTKKVT